MPRIFIAVPANDEVRSALGALPRHEAPYLRWVPEHQLHITLKFLGEVAEVDLVCDGVKSAVNEALGVDNRLRSTGVGVSAIGIGAFPSVNRARIIWAGVTDCEGLRGVQARIVKALVARGFPADERPFKPHITVARARSDSPLPAPLRRFAQHHFGSWRIDSVQVLESRLAPTGPHYTLRHSIALSPE